MSKKTIKIIISIISVIALTALIFYVFKTFEFVKYMNPAYEKVVQGKGFGGTVTIPAYEAALGGIIIAILLIAIIIVANILFLTKYKFRVLTPEALQQLKQEKLEKKKQKLEKRLKSLN